MKAIANTTIRLGLINLPVQVAQAEESAMDISFKTASPKGEPVEQRYVVKGTTDLIDKDDLQKGIFEDPKAGTGFHPIDKSAIENINAQTKMKDLNVTDVITFDEADKFRHRIRGMYFLQMAKGGSANSMKLFVDALALEGKCMVTKWTPRSRQELMVIRPQADEDGANILVGYSYAFAGDMRSADETVRAHLSGTYSDAEMAMAKQLLSALSDTNADTLEMEIDEALPLRHKLVNDALQGKAVHAPEAAPEQPEKNEALADALAQALAAVKEKVTA